MPLEGEYAPSKSAYARKQAERYEATDGAEAGKLNGRPVVVVTNKGARTGKVHKTALMRVEHDGSYAAVASKGGAATDPKWADNLRANPLVELQDRETKHDYQARELAGRERSEWWERAVEAYPPYAGYQRKTEREIPVFLLEPME